jgi:hypothetical protein
LVVVASELVGVDVIGPPELESFTAYCGDIHAGFTPS